jgi:hypothetical protein
MREKINEEVLCILRNKDNELIIDYEPIEINFADETETFSKLCQTNSDNLLDISNFLKTTESIKPLQKIYKYCQKLDGSYQGFTVNFEERVKQIIQFRDLFYHNQKNNEEYNIEEEIFKLQYELEKEFALWVRAYNIEKTYRKCFDDKQILTFSHRINGWSNPEYKLSENFTVELKTNFGFGSASYFYVKLKYKNIEITPFSDWIAYEIAKFSEIIRYTKSFADRLLKGIYNGKRVYEQKIENSNWQVAIDYAKTACNVSLKDEVDFVRKYIIDECEKMVEGLENIYSVSEFTFKCEHELHYKIDKAGHQLMEFRGEKISGALDFISKILEFDKIAEIKSFITRIENVNRKIQPLLVVELKNIKLKLADLNAELAILKPKYLKLVADNQNYIKQKNELKDQMIISKELDLEFFDNEKLHKAFLDKFPEFEDFEKQFTIVKKSYNILAEQIQNFNKLFKNITTYNLKILKHFGK